MDAAKKETYKLSKEWIDRLFQRLIEIYGHKFTDKFSKPEYMDLEKERWRSGLYGLTGEQVRSVLNLCLNNKIKEPPNVVEFFHYAKQWKTPAPEPKPHQKASPETYQHHMNKIRETLKNGNRSNTTLSQQDQRQ